MSPPRLAPMLAPAKRRSCSKCWPRPWDPSAMRTGPAWRSWFSGRT